jgi:hypothetical protein
MPAPQSFYLNNKAPPDLSAEITLMTAREK